MAKTGVVSIEISIEKHIIRFIKQAVTALERAANEPPTQRGNDFWLAQNALRNALTNIGQLGRLERREPNSKWKVLESTIVNSIRLDVLFVFNALVHHTEYFSINTSFIEPLNKSIYKLQKLQKMELRLG